MGQSWEFWQRVLLLAGPLIGFLSAWALFELTERRRIRLAQRALREALIAELQHIEVLSSSIVGQFAHLAQTPEEVKTAAREIRWSVQMARNRPENAGIGPLNLTKEAVTRLFALSDEDLVGVFATKRREEGIGSLGGTTLILPVVDAALAGRTSGFTAGEIEALSTVRWQAHLLDQDAEWMKEFLHFTFTITDEGNHAIASASFERRSQSYSRRAEVLLRCVRAALQRLGAPPQTAA